MFRFVREGSEITPGISIDKEHRILFLMFATYQHRWCLRFRWRRKVVAAPYPYDNSNRFSFKKTHWTLDDDNRLLAMRYCHSMQGRDNKCNRNTH